MADRTVMVTLGANVTGFVANMQQAQRASSTFADTSVRGQQQAESAQRRMANTHAAALRENADRERAAQQERAAAYQTAGTALAAFGAITIGALGASVKAAIDWETAWTGVLKTVDGTPGQLAKVEDGLRGLARELPISHAELAGVAEAAGQLGIATDDVVGFTKVMIDLGQTTNLSATEAATSLARISNIMGTSAKDVDRMGATIVELGNNSATTEGEIVALSTRLAAAAKQAGLSEANVFAFASTLTSVGVEAEAGGTAISKVFTSIADATKDGGDNLETFASVAGMSASQFKAAFEEDAAGGVAAFIEGMGRMANSGASTTQIFKDLELNDSRLKRAVLSTGAASGLLTEQLEMANDAWESNTALLSEAEKRYGTTASKIESAKGSIYDAAITMGETFLPAIAGVADGVSKTADAFGRLPAPIQATIGVTTALVGGTALLAGGFLLLLPRIIATRAAFQTLATPRLAGATLGLGTGLAAMAGQAAGIAVLTMAVGALVNKITTGEAAPKAHALAKAITEVAESGDISKLDAQFDNFGKVLGVNTGQVDDLAGAFDMMLKPSNTDKLTSFVSGFPGLTTYMEKTEDRVKSLDASLVSMVEAGDSDTVMAFQSQLMKMGYSAEEINRILPGTVDAMLGVKEASGGAAEGNVLVANSFGQVKEMSKEAAEALEEWKKKVREASMSFISPTDAYQAAIEKSMEWAQAQADATEDAEDSWENFYDGQTVSMQDYLAEQQRQLDAQRDYNKNLIGLQSLVSAEYFAFLEGLGKEGAPLIATLANALPEELAASDATYQAGLEEANKLVDGLQAGADGKVVSVTIGADGELAYTIADQTLTAVEEMQVQPWDLGVDPRPAIDTAANSTIPLLSGMTVEPWDLRARPENALSTGRQTQTSIGGMTPSAWAIDAKGDNARAEANRVQNEINAKSATIKVGATEAPGLWGSVNAFVANISSRTAVIGVSASMARPLPGMATGGPVSGPGTGTSDSIPTLLSNGEHVLTAREVQAMGGHGVVEQWRARALGRDVQAFAAGGRVMQPTYQPMQRLYTAPASSGPVVQVAAPSIEGMKVDVTVAMDSAGVIHVVDARIAAASSTRSASMRAGRQR